MTDNQLMDLYRKVSLFGLSDLRKLAPIGDIGYLNGISFYRGSSFRSFLRSTLLDWVYKAYCEQFKMMGWTERASKSGRCIHDYYCPELGFSYGVDSSD
jgi:hypothetical protein